MSDLLSILRDAGFQGEHLRQAWAVLMRESGGNSQAHNTHTETGDNSYGLFQINMLNPKTGGIDKDRDAKFRQHVEGYTGPDSLLDPVVNARAAAYMSNRGTNWYNWDIDKSGYNGGTHAGAYQKWYAQYPGDNARIGVRGGDQTLSMGGADTYGLKPDSLNMADLQSQYGIAAAVLADPESGLTDVLQQIISQKITDPNRQMAMLQATPWFQKHTAQWLDVEKSRASKDPALWNAAVDRQTQTVMEQFQSAGAQVDEATARKYAEQLLYGSGWNGGEYEIYDDKWLKRTIAGAIDFTKTKTVNGVQIQDLHGDAATKASALYEIARAYGMDTSGPAFQSWLSTGVRGWMDGTTDDQQLKTEAQQQALSMFPGMAPQLQRGMTLRDAVDPYLRKIATTLELDPESIDLNDNLVQRVLNNVDEKGQFKPISLYDTTLAARKDNRWQRTQAARNEYTSKASAILSDFGFLG